MNATFDHINNNRIMVYQLCSSKFGNCLHLPITSLLASPVLFHYLPAPKTRAIFEVNDLAITAVWGWHFYSQLEEQPAQQIYAQFTL